MGVQSREGLHRRFYRIFLMGGAFLPHPVSRFMDVPGIEYELLFDLVVGTSYDDEILHGLSLVGSMTQESY